MRTFVSTDGKKKFWKVELKGASYTTTSGKEGAQGRSSTRTFPDEAAAAKAVAKLLRKKREEGYQETTPTDSSPTLAGLEAALVEGPDDLATHKAYADYLHEQGDIRGDLIQVQLTLERQDLPGPERKQLAAREKTLLEATADACLGEQLVALRARDHISEHEPDWRAYAFDYTIRRGWLSRVVQNGLFDRDLVQVLVQSPQARLLRELAIRYMHYYQEMSGDPQLRGAMELLPYLRNLRALQVQSDFEQLFEFPATLTEPIVFNTRYELFLAADAFWDVIGALPNLEELDPSCRTQNTARLFGLPSLRRLRLLQLHLTDDYPVQVLAQNPALGNLTHLSFHPVPIRQEPWVPILTVDHLTALARSPNLPALTHLRFQRSSAGDQGVRHLIESGLLGRLKFLDLAMGTITDAGADLLAGAHLGQLEVLDLSANAISPAGQARLRAALSKKLTLRLVEQDTANPQAWLYEGECE